MIINVNRYFKKILFVHCIFDLRLKILFKTYFHTFLAFVLGSEELSFNRAIRSKFVVYNHQIFISTYLHRKVLSFFWHIYSDKKSNDVRIMFLIVIKRSLRFNLFNNFDVSNLPPQSTMILSWGIKLSIKEKSKGKNFSSNVHCQVISHQGLNKIRVYTPL